MEKGKEDFKVFKKLYSFYKSQGIKRISSKKYVENLIKEMKKKNIKNKFIEKILDDLLKKDEELLMTTLHGDFAKQQVLEKSKDIFFIDWETRKGLIIEDLVSFFRKSKNLLNDKKFMEILEEVYPKGVSNNIEMYLILNRISKIVRKGKVNKKNIDKLKSLLKQVNFNFKRFNK